jgi:hypothetical protein
MRKIHFYLGGMFALLLLVGAGCPSNDTATKQDASEKNSGDTMMQEGVVKKDVSELTLSAQAIGDRKVQFAWQVPEALAAEAEGYRFSRGVEANPDVNTDGWWWERGPAHRELEWEGLPTGPAHFRACVLKDDTCIAFSNDVEVDVK